MAVTLRTVINRVLTAVGEAPVGASVSDLTPLPLPLKVLEFINQIKEEIEDATYWRALRQTFTVTVPIASGYPNSPTAIAGTDERSRVIRVPEAEAGQLVPLVFDITNASTTPVPLGEIAVGELIYRLLSDGSSGGASTVQPSYFAVDMSNS